MAADSVSTRIPQDDLSALLEVSLALAESLQQAVVLQTAIDAGVRVLGLDTGAIYLVEGEDLVLGATTPPLPADFPDALRTAPIADHPHIMKSIAGHRPVMVPDASKADFTVAERAAIEARELCSVLYVPLMVEGTAEGVMIMGTQLCNRDYTSHDVDVCRTLSAQIALAIQNTQLLAAAQDAAAELRGAYDATLEGWSLALEMRDEQTLGHTQRAAQLACEIARELGVPDCDIPHVRRGALLHDIGKMVIPDAILKKAGPLDDAEWAVMRAHPVVAQEFLSRIAYLAPALDIPYYHHERWDGSGYPRGLRGTAIPLAARIFAVIDVYDALTSDRPYRAAWTAEEALQHIQRQAGAHFDPSVVEVFVERLEAAHAIVR